ncbi:phage antirepressor [Deinococcus wulumuqiensis]|uniref:phage antirepressor n=1 Tax=Deinococcus wulumuqiensis TaxID=980427 RepID=UPI00242EF414|nr:phage antirepressor [Deinococcus wulumuqiensis]
MTELQTFQFDASVVRTVMVDGQPWFVAADVALILGYQTTKDATRVLDEDEKGGHILPTPGGAQEFTIINESGLYGLVLRSRRPEAKRFRRWVTGEVLPAIHRGGSYSLTPQEEIDPLVLAHRYIESETARRALAAENAVLAPQAEQFQALMSTDGTYSVADAAKILGTGEMRLFTLLRDRRILMDKHRSGVENHNIPYQEYLDRGYFTVITRPRPDNSKITRTTRVTPKGLAWLERNMRQQQLLPAPTEQVQGVSA